MSIEAQLASGPSAWCRPSDSWVDGVSAEEWGPHGWCLLHFVATGMPSFLDAASRMRFVAYVRSLAFALPCFACRRHCHAYFDTADLSTLRTRWDCVVLIGDFHNAVNARLGKPRRLRQQYDASISEECAKTSYLRFWEHVRRARPAFSCDEESGLFVEHARLSRELVLGGLDGGDDAFAWRPLEPYTRTDAEARYEGQSHGRRIRHGV